MGIFTNIVTLVACVSTMIYCYILAKRIHAFDNIQSGIGAVIEEMIRTTNDLQSAFNHTRHEIEIQSHRLQDKIDEGIALSEYLQSLLDEVAEKKQQMQAAPSFSSHPTKTATQNAFLDIQKTISQDDLEGVMPADLYEFKNRKKKPQIIIPGEEYI